MHKQTTYFRSPLGIIKIEASRERITSLSFVDSAANNCTRESNLLNTCIEQLQEYFNKSREYFSLPYSIQGTAFQKKVWIEVERIRYANWAKYKDIALALNNPNSCRAVGNAVRANPLPIIIPCHRILGSDGKLTGYSSGLWRKKWLLEHEKA